MIVLTNLVQQLNFKINLQRQENNATNSQNMPNNEKHAFLNFVKTVPFQAGHGTVSPSVPAAPQR